MNSETALSGHPIHPWYGPCDGLGDGGECFECIETAKRVNERIVRLEDACQAAERYIIKEYASQLWHEHASYDLEKARQQAEANPPEIVLRLRSALGAPGAE